MARLEQTYYPGQYKNSTELSFEPVPAGTYEVQITDADLKTSRNGDSRYIWLELTIVKNPEFNDRKIWARITTEHPKEQAVNKGRAQIMDLCEIFGFSQGFNDTDMLKGKLLGVKVKISEGTPDYPNKQNDVIAYLYPDGTPLAKHQTRAAQPDAPVERKRERPF